MVLDDEDLEEEAAHVEALLAEEVDRSRTAASCPDPGSRRGNLMSDEDIASLKRRHLFLEDFSDDFIRSTPVGDLMKIETTAIKLKEVEKSKDASDRLAANKTALASTFTRVEEGRDNRWSELHPARFLPGASCSATKLWLKAREHLGLSSWPAVGNYDMGAVGLAGYVSAKGWSELHNLSSAKLSVKLFNINSSGCRGSYKKTSDGEESDVVLEVEEFKLALRAMRTAFQLAMPWNYSVLALEGFFFQNNFCASDLANVDKKGWFLARFTDYVLELNSDRWRDAEPFLTTGELKVTWLAFFGAQPQSLMTQKKKPQQGSANKQGGGQLAKNPRVVLGICFAYNNGLCVKQPGSCKTAKGKDLKHICDHVADPSKPLEVCGKEHVRKSFH